MVVTIKSSFLLFLWSMEVIHLFFFFNCILGEAGVDFSLLYFLSLLFYMMVFMRSFKTGGWMM